ncbi:MAG: alkaline phosphatase D family protein [Bacteroidota bacterium]
MKQAINKYFPIGMLSFVFLFIIGCKTPQKATVGTSSLYVGQAIDFSQTLTTVAFGSCNDQEEDQGMWNYILRNRPQIWVWLGDNVYMDTENPTELQQAYQKQKDHPEYVKVRTSMPVIGTWDDHDYGMGDGNKTHPIRKQSKQLMLDFLDVPLDAPVRQREGAYQSYTFGTADKQVKVILLDTRYFRDPLADNPDPNFRYIPDPEADILGEAQWQWLEGELTNSTAAVHLIGSGTQLISPQHPFEKWSDYPTARARFIKLLQKTKPAHPIVLSGDRHIAELSKLAVEGLEVPLYDFTSSGLTHAYTEFTGEENPNRVGEVVSERNFGLIFIDWKPEGPAVKVQVRGYKNQFFLEEQLF